MIRHIGLVGLCILSSFLYMPIKVYEHNVIWGGLRLWHFWVDHNDSLAAVNFLPITKYWRTLVVVFLGRSDWGRIHVNWAIFLQRELSKLGVVKLFPDLNICQVYYLLKLASDNSAYSLKVAQSTGYHYSVKMFHITPSLKSLNHPHFPKIKSKNASKYHKNAQNHFKSATYPILC
jgi:hypothetical protein